MDQVNLLKVKAEEVPEMLFLSVSPVKVKEKLLQGRDQTDHEISPNLDTDGGNEGSVPNDLPELENDSDATSPMAMLLKKFQRALEERSITTLRSWLLHKVQNVSGLQIPYNDQSCTLEESLSDDLTEDEENVLVLVEILKLFKHPVPEQILKKFQDILTIKKIPFLNSDNSEENIFFVCTENDILMKVCRSLSTSEVHQMYEHEKVHKRHNQDDAGSVTLLTLPNVTLDDLEKVDGLKNVAFYCLVLRFMYKKQMNRIYTHELDDLLSRLKTSENAPRHDHIDQALAALSRYPLAIRPPGLCLIFNMQEGRDGSSKDQESVENLFKNVFKYHVMTKVNPTKKKIETIISKLQASKYKYYDSLVVWFMSHGNEYQLSVKGGEIYRRIGLIKPFAEIEWLNKKPKLFFIQACANRQEGIDDTNTQMDQRDPINEPYRKFGVGLDYFNINNMADTLVSNATMWHNTAARSKRAGCIYVDTLVDKLKEFGRKESIENVLRRVHHSVNAVTLRTKGVMWKQTPYYESSLQREFIFP